MEFVIDSSVAVASCLRDEQYHDIAQRTLERLEPRKCLVPIFFWSEVRNVLIVAERRGRISRGSAGLLVVQLRELDLLTDVDQVDADVIVLARDHNLAGYDAEFLETAIRRNARLVTFDKKLLSAAKRAGVAFDLDEPSTTV